MQDNWTKNDFEIGQTFASKGDLEIVYLARTKAVVEQEHFIVTIREITKRRLSTSETEQLKQAI